MKAAGHSTQQRVEDGERQTLSSLPRDADHILPGAVARAQLGRSTFLASYGLGMSSVFTKYPLWLSLHVVKVFLASISSSGKGEPQWHCASQTS